jgi:hypothetical protein
MTVRVVDTSQQAEKTFRTFMARDPERRTPMRFSWPKQMQEVGVGQAVMYRSNKWKRNRQEYEDYKHIAEAEQAVYVTPGFLRDWTNPRRKIEVHGPLVTLEEPMPKHFAVLAPLLGVQLRLSGPDGQPMAGDAGLFEVTVKHGMLGAAVHPVTDEPFLFVYTNAGGVHMLLTGKELDIEKDGIVG